MRSLFARYLACNITILQTIDITVSSVWSMLYVTLSNGKCMAFFKLLKIKLTNANIPCLVRFGSGRNKLVQLLTRSRNSGSRTIRSLLIHLVAAVLPIHIIADNTATKPFNKFTTNNGGMFTNRTDLSCDQAQPVSVDSHITACISLTESDLKLSEFYGNGRKLIFLYITCTYKFTMVCVKL